MHLLEKELFCAQAKIGAGSGAGVLHENQSTVNPPALGNTSVPGTEWHGVHLCQCGHIRS